MHACWVASVMSDSVTLWTVACQAPLSMGFYRPEYWSGLQCPPPGDLPDPGIEPTSPAWQWILYHRATWEGTLLAEYLKTKVVGSVLTAQTQHVTDQTRAFSTLPLCPSAAKVFALSAWGP